MMVEENLTARSNLARFAPDRPRSHRAGPERAARPAVSRHTGPVRVTLIVNPFASSVTPRTRVRIQSKLAAGNQLEVIETTKGGHAIRLAHRAARAGSEVIVALGGDGTINEVANGVLAPPGQDGQRVLIAPLPGGSTNVFARALGYPNDPVEAATVLVDAIGRVSVRSAGVGLANGRAFLFHAGAGFDAAVVGRVERRGPLKRYLGHPLFVAATVDTWLRRVERRHPWFSIESADGRRIETAHLAVALNCNPYTYLGARPLDLAPAAELDTPLSIVALRSLSPLRVLPVVAGVIASGRGIVDGPATARWDGVGGAVLRGYRPFPYQLDGEAIGTVDELRLEHRPDAVDLLVPAAGPDAPTAGRDALTPARPRRRPGRW